MCVCIYIYIERERERETECSFRNPWTAFFPQVSEITAALCAGEGEQYYRSATQWLISPSHHAFEQSPPLTLTLSLASWVAIINGASEREIPARAWRVFVHEASFLGALPVSFLKMIIHAIQLKKSQEDKQVVLERTCTNCQRVNEAHLESPSPGWDTGWRQLIDSPRPRPELPSSTQTKVQIRSKSAVVFEAMAFQSSFYNWCTYLLPPHVPPSCFCGPGSHTEGPDVTALLSLWIPLDFSILLNQGSHPLLPIIGFIDLKTYRFIILSNP